MDQVWIIDGVRALHFIGLAAGFGIALFADVIALKCLLLPIQRTDARLLVFIHKVLIAALVLLWISGIGLLQLRTNLNLAEFSPKLITKLAVVTLLTANAWIIYAVAIPTYARHLGWRFTEMDIGDRIKLAVIAAVSLSCWLSALALGVFTQMKTMDALQLQSIFISLYLVALIAALVLAVYAPRLSRLSIRAGSAFRRDGDWTLPAGVKPPQ